MSKPNPCEECGNPLPQSGDLDGNCPHCMLELAIDSRAEGFDNSDPSRRLAEPASQDAQTARHPQVIARYKILRLIGEGGMGVVYEAEQEHPRRIVALKIIKPGMASPRLLRRFEQESQALGRLQHPGIAQIHEAGTADTGFGPQPYFAMELIRGKTLTDYVETHRLNTRQRLGLIVKVAEAVHHAHQRGLIHRDLKPGNILVDETGQPKILDFGVARATDSDTQSSSQTDLGQLVGTLAYMSPEQVLADALEIDTRSDVYALGVILYELLSGRLPYTISKHLHETIHAIKEEDPARLSLVSRTYRGDIETIAAKALEKDKARRYGSAAELAADIQRYLHDEPIMAQPQSAAYQLQKFARRHKALVAGTAAVFVVLAAGVVTATSLAVRARRAEQAAVAESHRARQAEADADLQRDLASQMKMDAENERDKFAAAETRAVRERDRATWNSLAEKSIRLSASRDDDELAALLARQAFLIHARTPDQPRYLVEQALQQANRISLWSRNISGHEGAVHSVEISRDGLRLASAGADRVIRVWNLEEPGAPPALFSGHTGIVNVVAFSPDGTHFASGGSDALRIWNLREPPAHQLLPDGYPRGNVDSLAYSPDGMRIAYVDDDGAWILDLRRSGSAPYLLAANDPNPFTAIAFSPRDERVAAGDLNGGVVRVWDLRTPGVAPMLFHGHQGYVRSVAFSPDGKHLASAASSREFDWRIRIWDLSNPLQLPALLSGQESQPNSLAFSPDGKLASAGEDGIVRIWDLRQLDSSPMKLNGHDGGARSVAFSPDGTRLVSGGNDFTVRVWNARDSSLSSRPFKAHEQVTTLAFSPDNAFLATGSRERMVRVWNPRDPTRPLHSFRHESLVTRLAFSPNGARLASATYETVRVWNMQNLDAPPRLLRDSNGFLSIAFSHDSAALVTLPLDYPRLVQALNRNGATPPFAYSPPVKRWNLRTGFSETIFQDPRISYYSTLSESLNRLASFQEDGSILVWDLRHPHVSPVRFPGPGHKSNWGMLAFSNDERFLASVGARDFAVRVWNLANTNTEPVAFRGASAFPIFSLDDSRLLAGSNSDIRLWDLREPNAPPVEFKVPSGLIGPMALSQDGTRLAYGDQDGNVWVWNLWTAAADELCTRVSRNLTSDEWRLHVGKSIPYERTCPALPAGTRAPR